MDLLALTHLVCEKDDEYIKLSNKIVNERHQALYKALGLKDDTDANDAQYYALLDLVEIAKNHYDADFAKWLDENIDCYAFLNDFAEQYGVVLMYGPGFNGPDNSVRASLANLNTKDYKQIGKRMFKLMDGYHERYEGEK